MAERPTIDGGHLRRWRRATGLTQAHMAHAFGVSERQWRRYERGTTPVPEAVTLRIWKSLVTADERQRYLATT